MPAESKRKRKNGIIEERLKINGTTNKLFMLSGDSKIKPHLPNLILFFYSTVCLVDIMDIESNFTALKQNHSPLGQ